MPRPTNSPLLLTALGLLLVGVATAPAQPRAAGSPSRESRLPQGTSRLTTEQRLRAVELASQHIKEAGLRTDERLYLVSVHWLHDKKSSDLKAKVRHYRTDGDLTLTHRINLTEGRIEQFHQASDKPTSLSRQEFEIARELALADPAVRKALGQRKDLVIEPMVLRGGSKDDEGHGHRLVRLLFKDGKDYLRRPVVFVDLTEETVLIEQKDPDAPQ